MEPCYIGSNTKHYLSQRMSKHKANYSYWKKKPSKQNKLTSFILFKKYEIENCSIVLLESVNAMSKDEPHRREQYYMNQMDCVNMMRAINTIEDYKQ